MIGVIIEEKDKDVVRELFELFKTPWEFFCRDNKYDVVISMTGESSGVNAELVIIYGSSYRDFDRKIGLVAASSGIQAVLCYRKKRIPIYRGFSTFENSERVVIRAENTSQAVGIEVINNKSRIIRIGVDLIEEIRFLLSIGQPVEYATITTLEYHISIIRDLIVGSGIPLIEIPPVPPGFDCIACCTHDVDFVGLRFHKIDRTVLGFCYRATLLSLWSFLRGRLALKKLLKNLLAAMSLPLIFFGLARDFFNQFEQYLQIEKNLRSTFFVIPYKKINGLTPAKGNASGRAARYDVNDIQQEVESLLAKGCEIGLHAIDAWRDSEKAEDEKERIKRITGRNVAGVRVHWLYYDEQSPKLLEKAGFCYDSTYGYNECVGFRGGTTQVFRPFGVKKLLELPLNIQDTALYYSKRMGLTQNRGVHAVEDMLAQIRDIGGVLTVNWHQRSLGPERLWDDSYRHVVKMIENDAIWSSTAYHVVEWFAQRRSVEFNQVDSGRRGKITVTCKRNTTVPGLLLRSFNYSPNGREAQRDIPFSDYLTIGES
ncbi:MAG: hypothetical protein JXQ30_07725 [Spirochaetes bacterium]|nr:hypothetical protein [Spirochaetota bacterium]